MFPQWHLEKMLFFACPFPTFTTFTHVLLTQTYSEPYDLISDHLERCSTIQTLLWMNVPTLIEPSLVVYVCVFLDQAKEGLLCFSSVLRSIYPLVIIKWFASPHHDCCWFGLLQHSCFHTEIFELLGTSHIFQWRRVGEHSDSCIPLALICSTSIRLVLLFRWKYLVSLSRLSWRGFFGDRQTFRRKKILLWIGMVSSLSASVYVVHKYSVDS